VTVPELILQLEAQQASLDEPVEGLEDLLRLKDGTHPITAPTADALTAQLETLKRRQVLIRRAVGVLKELDGDGYPALPAKQVDQSVLDNVQHQIDAALAAKDFFSTGGLATNLNLSPGVVREK
jgi:hypothetical protein